MILGLLLNSDELLVAKRSSEDSWEFHRCTVNWTEPGESSGRGFIWDRVEEGLRKAYLEAEKVAVALPASACMIKRIKIVKKLEDGTPGYRKWRAGIELPGDPELFGYGFIPLTEGSGDSESESIFFASPVDYLRRLICAVVRANDSGRILIIPEQMGLVELARRSAGSHDQAALVHFDRQSAVVVILRDGEFFKGRYFLIGEGGFDDIIEDIEVFLFSVARSDESFPVIVTGSADSFKTTRSPVLPPFLDGPDLDFSSAWGITEFVIRGGTCELQAGL